MEKIVTFTLNGKSRTVTTHPERPLLDVLREDLQLTGTKYGCGEGQCRACTVLVGGKSVVSCMTPVANVDNKSILTIEALANGDKLHPVQEAFLAEGAFQCGYCTPGMVLGLAGLMDEKPRPTEAEMLSRMNKHICRCCSYTSIRAAIRRVAGSENK
jgi:aerobic-type carbon monoxide dehydrogenase small subunit (CoxS/CutS family)